MGITQENIWTWRQEHQEDGGENFRNSLHQTILGSVTFSGDFRGFEFGSTNLQELLLKHDIKNQSKFIFLRENIYPVGFYFNFVFCIRPLRSVARRRRILFLLPVRQLYTFRLWTLLLLAGLCVLLFDDDDDISSSGSAGRGWTKPRKLQYPT